MLLTVIPFGLVWLQIYNAELTRPPVTVGYTGLVKNLQRYAKFTMC